MCLRKALIPLVLCDILLFLLITFTHAGPDRSLSSRQASAIAEKDDLQLLSLNPQPNAATSSQPPSLQPRVIPNIPSIPPQIALPDSWVATLHPFSTLTSLSPSASRGFESFWRHVMASALAQILNNTPLRGRLRFRFGSWRLTFVMNPRSSVQQFQWTFVYYFARYMLRWAERGLLGYGGVTMRHPSGVLFQVAFGCQGR